MMGKLSEPQKLCRNSISGELFCENHGSQKSFEVLGKKLVKDFANVSL